jgi:ribosome-associated protein
MAPAMPVDRLLGLVIDALEDLKAVDIKVLDVTGITSITDRMVVAGGTSTRHVKSIADNVVRKAKQAGNPPLGVEGEQAGEWVLIDLGDVVVHVMLPPVRAFYALEKLWSVGSAETPDSP